MKTMTVKCGKCDGKGRLSWTRNASGVCFACDGRGVLLVDETTIAAHKMDRATCIAGIKRALDMYAAHGYSDEMYTIASYIVRADADVAERALVAYEKLGGIRSNMERQIAHDRANLGRKISNVRKVG